MDAIIAAATSILSTSFIALGIAYYTICRNFKERIKILDGWFTEHFDRSPIDSRVLEFRE